MIRAIWVGSLALLVAMLLPQSLLASANRNQPTNVPPARVATAIFAGGCFWCTESDFEHMPGVINAVSGYAGGRVANPTYEQVSAGNTGHIESVLVTYDPRRISYTQLLVRFVRTVDPTDAGGSFCDRGYHYRSAIFVGNAQERRAAQQVLANASRQLRREVSTLVLARPRFWPAEDYHQNYARENPVRYTIYRRGCGRDARLRQVWGG